MYEREEEMFTGTTVNDRVETVKANALKDIKDGRTYHKSRPEQEPTPGQLIEKYRINVPAIGDPKAKVLDDGRVEYTIPYKGDSKFFHISPDNSILTPRPKATIISDCFYVTLKNSGDADSIKKEFNERFGNFTVWYEAVKKDVEEFNANLPAFISDVFKEASDTEKNARALEDELNS